MNKSRLALAALTACAGAASAQSSVTLFGVMDLSVNSVKIGTASVKLLSSDQLSSSRLGFRGEEDLGGGMRAGFWLDTGLAPDTGASGGDNGQGTTVFWNRRSTVSLVGGFGEIRLGRDHVLTYNNRAAYDPFGVNGMGSMGRVEAPAGLGSGVMTGVRDNNLVGYILPNLGGIIGGVQVGAGEGNAGQKYLGARLGYAAGPLSVSGAFGKTYKTGTMAADFKQFNFGGSFNAGFLTIEGMFDKLDYGAANQKHLLIGALVPYGVGTLKASYNQVRGDTTARGAKMFSFGYQYDLSRRTSLYATYSSLNNDGDSSTGAAFTVATTPGLTPTKGGNSSGYNAGVRHSF